MASEAQARAKIQASDAARGKSIFQMTGHDWMAPENYHLCLDSSALPLPEVSRLLFEFVQARMK